MYAILDRERREQHQLDRCLRADRSLEWAMRLVGAAAVEAAFRLPWNNGIVEGHVNRLKFLKRQMFGRAHLDLLRVKVLHAV